jgi:uncharacterized protein YxeA
MKKIIMTITAAVITMTATGVFAEQKYDCQARVIQMTSKGKHNIKQLEDKATSAEAFRSKIVALKTGKADYTCTAKDEHVSGLIDFHDGKTSRREIVTTGLKPGETEITGLMPGVHGQK